MQRVMIVFAVAALVAILTTACQHAGEELANGLGCHLAGNGCPSVNLDDPNLRGPAGPAGADGVPGERGLPSPTEQFTTVRFCARASAYPTLFAEYGICIKGHLYAVYSIPASFLTLIPPGRYSSTGINSTCNFTVKANCEVVP